ncbi:hypothetical protein [Roseibium sp.]|uniref:hypothetical protein n=1 Tax=Roseibium sp. TaxID=1936156 RepID=UPI003267C2AC
MPSNKAAAKKLRNCISDLWLSRSKGRTTAQIDRIDAELRRVEEEYFAILGVPANASYAELTGDLTRARNGLNAIRQDRDDFTNGLVTATKLLGSISAVLKLI